MTEDGDAFRDADDYMASRGQYLPADLKGLLRLAVFRLTPLQRQQLRRSETDILYVGRDDFAFTVRRRNAPSRYGVVVLQPELLGLVANAIGEVHRAVLDQTTGNKELPAPCALDHRSIEAGRFLDEEHRRHLRELFQRMPEWGRSWLERRGRSTVIIANSVAVYGVTLLDVPTSHDLIILNAKCFLLPDDSVLGILCHELGHLAYRDEQGQSTPQTTQGEIEADKFAVACGFRDALRAQIANEITTSADLRLRAQLEARVNALS